MAATRLTAFTRHLRERAGRGFADYAALHEFSIRHKAQFWEAVWEFCEVRGHRGERAVIDDDRMPGARFFPDARLNFAENVLRRDDHAPAIIAETEQGGRRTVTFAELGVAVRRVAAALVSEGVRPGDRVAGVVANIPEAIIAALGAAAVGAIWSSCSPDFGADGVVDRFGQIKPVLLFAVDGHHYGGKRIPCDAKIADVIARLPTVRRAVIIPLIEDGESPESPIAVSWADWLAAAKPGEAPLKRFSMEQPLYILFSSGTTGLPKCIVHGAGGTLMQHVKEHQLHCDVKPGDRVFYFTTCGWMMWNWLVTALASGATIVLYDGSPFFPDGHRLFTLADETSITLLGASAKFIDAAKKAGLRPRATHSLESLRTITSTGSPLAPESFDFVYEHLKPDVHLASISGGTDIVSCFVGGNPNAPVWRGEIQAPGLGMDVDVFNEHGERAEGQAGELVCKSPFPSMPLGFWNDPGNTRYREAYFERFPGVWSHGDWAERTDHGGLIIHGRSDATLNPGGVRIGTAEIYRQVEQLPEVIESLAVAQHWNGDERIVLFLRLRDGLVLDDDLRGRISTQLRTHASPRHVPARMLQVQDLPRTKSGKLVEMAVREVVHGREVKNRDALANPESLEQFRDRPELQS